MDGTVDGQIEGEQTAADAEADAGAPNWPTGWRTVPEGTNDNVDDADWGRPHNGFFSPSAEASSPIWAGQAAAPPAPVKARKAKKTAKQEARSEPATGRYSDRSIAPYSGFWRRFWSLSIDVMTHFWVQALLTVAFGLTFMAIVALINLADLGNDRSFDDAVRGFGGLFWVFVAVRAILFFVVWYQMIPRKIAADGATFGMEQLGIEARGKTGGHFLTLGVSMTRVLLGLVVSAATTALGIVLAAQLVDVDLRADALGLQQLSVAKWFIALLAIVTLGALPSLLMAVDRTHQTLPDKLTGTTFKNAAQPSWLAVAAFASAELLLFPVAAVLGHLALAKIRRSNGTMRGRGLAVYSLVVAYVTTAALIAGAVVLVVNGSDDANTSTERQQISLVTSLIPTEATFPPDLVRLAPNNKLTYSTAGCQQTVFGSTDISAEVRYTSPTAGALGLPAALSVWAGSYEETSDITRPSKVPYRDLTACTFFGNSVLSKPTVTTLRPDERSVLMSKVPYELASGLQRTTGTLYIAMAVHGHVALMVTGVDEAQVTFLAESTIDRVP